MNTPIFGSRKSGRLGFWKMIAFAVAALIPVAASSEIVQTIYKETPVRSYYAHPNDTNFVPEYEFMMRTDSLNYDQNIFDVRSQEYAAHPGVQFAERPVVVCRDFGCTRLNDRITRTFLFNSLANIFMLNAHSRLYICEADPFSRACLQSGISFPVRVGIANAMIKIPKATINQVGISTGLSKATIAITYEFLVNGIGTRCEPTQMDIIVPVNSQATLASRDFACNMTMDGLTRVSLLINIDYIDLDYGILGGYYSFGLQGPTAGGGTGYALFKMEFTNSGMKMRAATATQPELRDDKTESKPGEFMFE
jgi:hypothetical protein